MTRGIQTKSYKKASSAALKRVLVLNRERDKEKKEGVGDMGERVEGWKMKSRTTQVGGRRGFSGEGLYVEIAIGEMQKKFI